MRVLHVSLLASLTVNGLLAFAYVVGRSSDGPSESPIKTPIPIIARTVESPEADATPPSWESLSQELSPALVAQLRAEGFPLHAIRAIVTHVLDQQFAERRERFKPRPKQYWQKHEYFAEELIDPELVPGRRALEREYVAAFEALLGADAYPENDAITKHEFGDLPPAKVARLKAIKEDYSEMAEAIRAATKGVRLPEDDAKLAYLEQEKRADLAALLTPEELLAYELRGSSTANGLRYQLNAFEPSEEEFVALFHVQRDVERELASLPYRPTADESRDLRERRVQAVLSSDRFEEYQTRTSGSYPHVSQLVKTLNLPESTVRDVIRTQHTYVREANAIRADPNLSAAERRDRLVDVSQRAREQVTGSLGETGLKNYLYTAAGKWLADLPPSPPTD